MFVSFLGRVVGSAVMVGIGLNLAVAMAEDAAPIAQVPVPVDTILCQTEEIYFAENGWTPYTADFDCADDAAHDYAVKNPGIGILVFVGPDSFPNNHFETPQQFGEAMVRAFDTHYGIQSAYFLAQTERGATGMRLLFGPNTYGSETGNQNLNLREAREAMSDVAALLRIHWGNQIPLTRRVEDTGR